MGLSACNTNSLRILLTIITSIGILLAIDRGLVLFKYQFERNPVTYVRGIR